MKKNVFAKIFVLALTILLTTFTVSAAGDFSVTPSTLSLNANIAETGSEIITVTNTGDTDINLTVSKIDLTDGTHTIPLTLSSNQITNLGAGETENITLSYNSGNNAGTFIGSVSVTNGTKTLSTVITLTVVQETVTGPSLVFEDAEGDILTIVAELGDEEKETFVLLNNGNETLTDIRIEVEDLDGGDEEIKEKYIEIDGDKASDFKLDRLIAGDTENIRIGVDVDDDLDVDTYRGDLTITAERPNGETYTKVFTLKVITESSEDDVFFKDNSGDVVKRVLEVFGEPDETVDDIEIDITNDAAGDINDLVLVLDGDLKEEDSSSIISKSNVVFDPNPFDIDKDDEETIDVEINIPANTPIGTYIADLELRSSSGKKLDEISLKVKVTGDVFVSKIEFDDSYQPGDDVDISITVENQGSKIYRNVKITGTLFDVEYGNGDITESTSTFILDSGEEKTNTLTFQLPDDAQDGEAILEIKVTYDVEELYELESINIERPQTNIVIDSYAINPRVAKCDKQIFTYIKFRNLGRMDTDVVVTTEIVGRNIEQSSGVFELEADEVDQQNLVLDISDLEPGNYIVSQKIQYGSLFVKRESDLKILECAGETTEVEIKPINGINVTETDGNETSVGTIKLFGTEMEKTTVYLGTSLAFIVILIIIGLFVI